jgi:RND family efflux transporter MFP subunit
MLLKIAAIITLALPTVVLAADNAPALSSQSDERFRGLVAPSRQVVLGAPLDGLVKEIAVDENTPVKAGDVLIRMDDELQVAAVELARLEIIRNELALGEAEIQLTRIEELAKSNAAQEWEVRRNKLQRDSADVAVQRAKETWKLEQARLTKYRLLAPFDGFVTRIGSEAGASHRQGEQMLTLVALTPLEAQMFLPVELYGKLETGMTYRVQAEDPVNGVLSARLKTYEPVIDSASRTFRCIFEIDNPEGKLPAGFSVRLIWPQTP